VMVWAETTVKAEEALGPKLTTLAPVNPFPVMVTGVPPPEVTDEGDREVTVTAGGVVDVVVVVDVAAVGAGVDFGAAALIGPTCWPSDSSLVTADVALAPADVAGVDQLAGAVPAVVEPVAVVDDPVWLDVVLPRPTEVPAGTTVTEWAGVDDAMDTPNPRATPMASVDAVTRSTRRRVRSAIPMSCPFP
jgi:hypothetical protein